jgi:uncharacterized protein YkwD
MRNLRSNHDNVPDLDRFGFRPLTNPTNFPQLEQRSHHSIQSSRPTPTSSSSSLATASSKRPTVEYDNSEFLRDALQVHNDLRRRHGVEPLRLNNDLTKLAQEWGKYKTPIFC